MRYREIKPSTPLRSFVECFWTLEGDGSVDSTSAERILPDGCVELILNFGDRFLQHVDDERRRQPRNFIVGQMTGPILISPTGAVELLGIRDFNQFAQQSPADTRRSKSIGPAWPAVRCGA